MKKMFSKVMQKVTAFVKKSAAACSELIGAGAARYRANWEADNKCRADAAHAVQEQQIRANLLPEYHFIAEMLMGAINNTADVTHFHPVPIVDRLKLRNCLGYVDGIWLMQFRARRFKGYSVTANDAQRILQSELDCICEYNSYTRLLLRVAFGADGTVRIRVAPAADVIRRRAEKIREVL